MGTIRANLFEFKSEQFTAETWPIAQVLVLAIVSAGERFVRDGCPANAAERLRLEEFANDLDAWAIACRVERDARRAVAKAQVFQQAFRAWLKLGGPEELVKLPAVDKVESLLRYDVHAVEGHGRNRDRMVVMFDVFVKTDMAHLDLESVENVELVVHWARAWAQGYMADQFASACESPLSTSDAPEPPMCQVYALAGLVKVLVRTCFVDVDAKVGFEVANGVRLGNTPHSVIRNDFPPPFPSAIVVSASTVTTGPASS